MTYHQDLSGTHKAVQVKSRQARSLDSWFHGMSTVVIRSAAAIHRTISYRLAVREQESALTATALGARGKGDPTVGQTGTNELRRCNCLLCRNACCPP